MSAKSPNRVKPEKKVSLDEKEEAVAYAKELLSNFKVLKKDTNKVNSFINRQLKLNKER